jgi:hypothetical protein
VLENRENLADSSDRHDVATQAYTDSMSHDSSLMLHSVLMREAPAIQPTQYVSLAIYGPKKLHMVNAVL